jgi:tetratricopeptide (TPR) repeat protein
MTGTTSTGNIFISYRREDSAAYAGRICDHLAARFGESRVFMDVEDIRPGQNFAQTIDQTIANCSAVLVIIGPRWIEILRNRSQEHQQDYVYHELECALARNITIIPVLVGGAAIAQLTDLPESLAQLTLHEAAEVRDDTFKQDCARLANALGAPAGPPRANKTAYKLLLWSAGAAALIAVLFAVLSSIGIGPWKQRQEEKTRVHQLLDTAQTQITQTEYESAFRTCQEALRLDPLNRAVMDRQADAAMLWLENFHVVVAEGHSVDDLAAPALSDIMSVLDAGLARTNGRGSRAADILAHLGWAHWLNHNIAYKEFGHAAEQTLRRSLSIDPSNVYGNAMLGNWLLQTHGNLDEALRHFAVAVKTGQQRPLVRSMQLGGMIYNDDPGVRPELIRLANQMRINSEPMDQSYKNRVLSNYSAMNSQEKLRETLSAVNPNDAWATFLWLDDAARGEQRMQNEFIHAGILEIAGKSAEALVILKALQHELKSRRQTGSLADQVTSAIERLSSAH